MKKVLLIILALVIAGLIWNFTRPASPRQTGNKRPNPIPDEALNPKVVAEVGEAYQKDIEPLLKRACFDCHSTKTDFPWYHHVPVVNWYLNSHVKEAREHLDMTDGFPFVSKRPLVSRIRGIGSAVRRKTMPLWDYSLMHPASHFTAIEEATIINWAEGSVQRLSATAKAY